MKTNRELIEERLFAYCVKKADEWGCDRVACCDDTTQGIWGKDFAKFLQSKFGDNAISQVRFTSSDGDRYVKFRHRFGNPCVCLSYTYNERQTLAEMELSDFDCNSKTHNDKFEISQFTIFSEDGLALAEELRKMWHEIDPECLTSETE